MSEHDELAENLEEPSEQEPAADRGAFVIDLNTATEDELSRLPGVGPVLATRIVDYREAVGPYDEPVDIVSVPGITASMYDGFAGRLTVSPIEPLLATELEQAEEKVEAETLEFDELAVPESEPPATLEEEVPVVMPEPSEPFDEVMPVVMPEPEELFEEEVPAAEPELEADEGEEPLEPIAEPPPFEVVSSQRRPGWGCLVVVGLVSIIVGALLSLLALRAINGTLNFQAASEQALRAEASRVDGEIGSLSNDVAELRSRMEAIEDLSVQLGEAQAEIGTLSEDLATVDEEIERMTGELEGTQAALGIVIDDVDELEENVVALQTQFSTIEDQLNTLSGELDALRLAADRFGTFLDGLRDLVERSARPTPEGSPFRQESPVPTQVPPTRQPVFTVIPLATPTPTP
jgi:competence ComEA-like helix-hairpin-helix protein